MDIFRDDDRLYLFRSARLSNNKVSFGPENRTLIRKVLALSSRMLVSN